MDTLVLLLGGSVASKWIQTFSVKVGCDPARFFKGKLPYFEASHTNADGRVVSGGWRGGEKWGDNSLTLHPVHVRQGVC